MNTLVLAGLFAVCQGAPQFAYAPTYAGAPHPYAHPLAGGAGIAPEIKVSNSGPLAVSVKQVSEGRYAPVFEAGIDLGTKEGFNNAASGVSTTLEARYSANGAYYKAVAGEGGAVHEVKFPEA